MIHYGLYTLGLVVMLPALYLMLHGGNTALEPIVAGGSLIAAAAAVLVFAFVVFSSGTVHRESRLSSIRAESNGRL
jgi:hypothetical protein